MPFSQYEPSKKYEDNVLQFMGTQFDPRFGDVASSLIDETLSTPGMWRSIEEAEIIARTEGNDMTAMYATVLPVATLGVRNIISAALEGRSLDETKLYRDLHTPMDQDAWEKSEFFRPGIAYHENMNLAYARVMSERHDREARNRFILSHASGGQIAGATFLSMGASIFDPVNLVTGIGVSAGVSSGIRAAGMTAAASRTGAFNLKAGSTTVHALGLSHLGPAGEFVRTPVRRAATEGALAAGGIEIAAHQVAGITKDDYDLLDSFFNLSASVALSAGLQGIASAYGRMKARRLDLAEQYMSTFLTEAIASGRDPVQAANLVVAAVNADSAPRFTTLTAEQLSTPEIKQVKGRFEARYPAEEGAVAGAVGRGLTKEEAIASLQAHYAPEFQHINASEVSPEYMQAVRRVQELENAVAEFGSQRSRVFMDEAKRRGIPIDELNRARDARRALRPEVEIARMRAEEFPQNKKFQRELTAIERKLDTAQQAIDDIQANWSEEISRLRNDMQTMRDQMRSEIAEAERFIVAEQQRNLGAMVESFYGSDPDNNAFLHSTPAEPEVTGASQRIVKADEATVSSREMNEIDARLKEMREQGLLNDDDIRAIDRVNDMHERDVAMHEALIASVNCLRG